MSNRKVSTTLRIGSRVEYTVVINGERRKVPGTIAYGPGAFHLKPNENDWCGVVLDEPVGKNNGTIQGRQYFDCSDNYGVFVRVSTLRPILDHGSRIPMSRTSRSSTPSSTPKSMTPSSSIQSFAGIIDGGDTGALIIDKNSKLTESINLPATSQISKIRPPTNLMSTSSHEISAKSQQQHSQSNIQKLVEKIETKRDEMIREDDAAQHWSQSSSTPTHKTKELQEANEKIKDLESKLNTLMLKRAEDRQKFKEFERLKIQNEQLLENKKQMAEKIAELSKSKMQSENEAREAREEQVRQAEEIKDLVDNAEMAVIDKEMAENKSEQLQLELEQLREQLEEAKLDFEILKTEIEDKGVDGAANSFQLKKLEDQNIRYKDALLKLRDISAADRTNIQMMQKDLERKNDEIQNLMQTNDKIKLEMAKCYEQIEILKEQVDMALGSQEMVEKLTEKNLIMEDKLEELQKALDEEEKIKELSNMIIEEKDDIIADLRDEVDKFKTNLMNIRSSFVMAQETIQDHENTIKKFRELVSILKEENGMLRAAQEQDHTKVQQAVDVQKQLANIEFKTRLLDRKDVSRAIDMELRQLDIDQCYRHMIYLSRFFPESFFVRGGDHDAIAVLLFIPRMFTKCFIIERQVLEKHSTTFNQQQDADVAVTPESILREFFDDDRIQVESSDKLKQQIFAKHIVYLLTSIRSTLDKYQDILGKCDSDLFMKLGSLYPELAAHEKNIDYFLNLLREDKLDETVSLDSLEKILNYLHSLYNIYIASTNLESVDNHNKFLNDLIDVLRTGTEASILDLKIISRMTDMDTSMFLSTMETSLNDIEQFGRKIRRRMISIGSGQADTNPACFIRFPSTVEAELLDSFHNFSLIVRSLKQIRQVLMNEFLNQFIRNNNVDGDTSNVDSDEMNKITRFTIDDLERTCKEWNGNSIKSLNEMLTNVMSTICKFCTIIQQGDYDISKNETATTVPSQNSTFDSLQSNPTTSLQLPSSFQSLFSSNTTRGGGAGGSSCSLQCQPLDQRALLWRQQSEQITDFRMKIQQQESDITELKRALKMKIDEISEIQIRRDLSEKKYKESLKEQQKLQDELERLTKEFKEKEAERERTLNKYNQEINDLYSDHRLMKEKLKDYSKNALFGKVSMLSSSTNSPLSMNHNTMSSTTSPMSLGNLSSIHHSPNISLSPTPSLNQSLLSNTTATYGPDGSSVAVTNTTVQTPMVSNDVLQLQQHIQSLRLAMKQIAMKNIELRTMLTLSNEEKIQINNDGELIKIRPKWYLDTMKQMKFQQFRTKLLQLDNDWTEYRLKSLMQIFNLDQFSPDNNNNKPGWTKCFADLMYKHGQQQKLDELNFSLRFQQLKIDFEQFIKTLDQNGGYQCDSTFTTFIAPHISKIVNAQPKLVARIIVGGGGGGKTVQSSSTSASTMAKIIPLEVTNDELNRLQKILLY
ncbi:dynactin subunit 1-like protein [Dermatophagoides farinae]|uniref:Dynactin subunit 1 n=1 Tax=Dermatophagoides farinae TaxID=6954 RepID=A0A9D4SCD3_DERFA|nr:dynactin subunit 1-like protein [Dermatophagoides farinae]